MPKQKRDKWLWKQCLKAKGKKWDLGLLIEAGKDHAYVIEGRDVRTVVCDATSNGWEWFMNVLCFRWGKARAHFGFAVVAKRIAEQIIEKVSKDKPLVVAGWSRGIIALLVAKDLHDAGYAIVDGVGFGNPMPGGVFLKRQLKKRGIPWRRYVMKGDRVANLLSQKLLGFCHYDTEVYVLEHSLKKQKDIHGAYGRFM